MKTTRQFFSGYALVAKKFIESNVFKLTQFEQVRSSILVIFFIIRKLYFCQKSKMIVFQHFLRNNFHFTSDQDYLDAVFE